jgi:hypothetical protein
MAGKMIMQLVKTSGRAKFFLMQALLSIALLVCLCSMPCPAHAGQWLRGDLHSHSTYSDGDSLPADIVAEAERLGLDFFALTDHDGSMSGEPLHWSDPGYVSDELVLLYGMEWTTALGHANVWAGAPFDYAPLWAAHKSRDAAAAALAAHDGGALFSINHPQEFVVCPWSYPVPPEADCVEIWNALYSLPGMNRMAAHRFWDDLLQQGRRITAVGGSDTHHLKKWMSRIYDMAMPTTWVWAQERTAEAILAGIKGGQVTISYASDALRLELAADADGDGGFETMMGDAAPESTELSLRLSVTAPGNETPAACAARELGPCEFSTLAASGMSFQNAANINTAAQLSERYLACFYKNGKLYRAWRMKGSGSVKFSAPAREGDYFRAELFGLPRMPLPLRLLYGYMIAVTNPVYVDPAAQ